MGVRTKQVVSVCAPNASVVYAVSPFARSDVKSQNDPSGTIKKSRYYAWKVIKKNQTLLKKKLLTLRLPDSSNPQRKYFSSFRSSLYSRNETESKSVLVEITFPHCVIRMYIRYQLSLSSRVWVIPFIVIKNQVQISNIGQRNISFLQSSLTTPTDLVPPASHNHD